MQEITMSELYGLPEDKLGAITLLGMDKGYASDGSFSVVMQVRDIHLNTHGTVHGGILYALCDQALGAYVTHKRLEGVGLDGSIHYYRPAFEGDVLTATAYERKGGRKIGVCFVELKNQDGKLIADGLFSAMFVDKGE